MIGLLKIIPGPEILKPTLSLTEDRFQQAEGDERCVSVWVMKAFESLHSYKKRARRFVIGLLLKIMPGPEILKPILSLTEGRKVGCFSRRKVSVWVVKAFESFHS